jgi:hypothetical protein
MGTEGSNPSLSAEGIPKLTLLQIELHPINETQKESPAVSTGQTPGFVRYLSCFPLYPYIVVKANIIINDLSGLLEGRVAHLAQGFFFQMSEEVFHRCIIPTITPPGHGRRDGILLGKDKIRL